MFKALKVCKDNSALWFVIGILNDGFFFLKKKIRISRKRITSFLLNENKNRYLLSFLYLLANLNNERKKKTFRREKKKNSSISASFFLKKKCFNQKVVVGNKLLKKGKVV